jgi:putative ABC transport system ATP-binding protein
VTEPGKTSGAPLLRLEHLRKRYREGDTDHVVLDGASLCVRAGEFVVLLGPSGSGKSTLINLAAGIDTADAGRILVNGVDLGALSERERTLFRRRNIGIVFQFFNLLATLTVLENVILPLELIGRGTERDRARDLLASVGLGGRGDSFPDRLSGGEQQRIALARALAHGPALLLADEPTGNLDAATGDGVVDLLETLARRDGAGLLVATHSERIVERADRVVRLEAGRVVDA